MVLPDFNTWQQYKPQGTVTGHNAREDDVCFFTQKGIAFFSQPCFRVLQCNSYLCQNILPYYYQLQTCTIIRLYCVYNLIFIQNMQNELVTFHKCSYTCVQMHSHKQKGGCTYFPLNHVSVYLSVYPENCSVLCTIIYICIKPYILPSQQHTFNYSYCVYNVISIKRELN